MGRRIGVSIWLILLVAASTLFAQQEIYTEHLQSIESLRPVTQGIFSAKANLFGVLSVGKGMKFYDPSTLKEKYEVSPISLTGNTCAFSASGQTVALGSADGNVYLVTPSAPTEPRKISIGSASITSVAIQDEGWLFTISSDKTVTLTDIVSGNTLGSLSSFQDDVTALALQPDGRAFAVGLATGQVQIYAIGKMEMQKTLSDLPEKISVIRFSPDGKFIAAGTANGSVALWNVATGELKVKYAQKGNVSVVGFDPKSRWLYSSAADSSMKFFDVNTLKFVKTLTEGVGYATGAEFINDGTLLAASITGTITKWKVSPTPPDTTNPIVILEQPSSNETPVKIFGREYSLRGYAFDDYDLKEVDVNGTPVVLMTMGPGDTVQIPPGMKIAKRFSTVIKLDSVGINPIEVKVSDKAKHTVGQQAFVRRLSSDEAVEVEYPLVNSETDGVSTQVKFKTWFDISSYSISVNMVDIVNGQTPEFKVAGDLITDEVPLVSGYNQIQLTVTSKLGDRFSKTFGINRRTSVLTGMPAATIAKKDRAAGSGPQKWAVVVGVSDYAQAGIPSLKYADKDAEAFANFLRRPEGGGYDSDHMRVLLNKDATLANIRDALINFLNQAIDMDLVVIYFAGHGAPEPARPQNMYLLTYDSDPTALGTTAFPMWDIQTVLARYINAKRVVVFTDACHSGNISVNFATRGLGTTEENLVNQYLTDLSKSKAGVVVFTASAAGEVSQEYPEFGHGVFTYYLLEGLEGKADYNNDNTVTINELMQYVEEQVKRKTHGAQNPTRSQTDYDKELTMSLIPH